MDASRILLVDDEPGILSVISTLLRTENYQVTAVLGGKEAKELLSANDYDLLITDIRMRPVDGMELLREAKRIRSTMPVIMLSAYGSVQTAIDALKMGAFDYLRKPFKVDELLIAVQHAIEYTRTLQENVDLRSRLPTSAQLPEIIAESPAMKRVCDAVVRVAPSDTTVLITGESGTGKELIARAIHSHSGRRSHSFLAVNCAALPEALLESEMFGHVKGAFTGATKHKEGLFQASNEGTLFLDEIGAMPMSIQGKLLRVLQERELRPVGSNQTVQVNVRIVAATNVPLEGLIAAAAFREDLYYRLSVIPIEVPSLRNRSEDIIPLANAFLCRESTDPSKLPILTPEVRERFETYSWPGNVRELLNAIKHAVTFAQDGYIRLHDLPPRILRYTSNHSAAKGDVEDSAQVGGEVGSFIAALAEPASLKDFCVRAETFFIRKAIERAKGNKRKAADELGVSLATLYRKLSDFATPVPENDKASHILEK